MSVQTLPSLNGQLTTQLPGEHLGSLAPDGPRKRLSVIILCYKNAGLVIDCLASLEGELDAGLDEAVVVENGSGDDSGVTLSRTIEERGWASWARIVQINPNAGFAGGNNAGLMAANAEAYVLLNSDTIVRPGAMRRLLEVGLEKRCMVAPRLEWPNGDEQINRRAYVGPLWELSRAAGTGAITRAIGAEHPRPAHPAQIVEAPWASFACMLLHRDVIERVGLLDGGFFMYFEDMDYCRSAWRAGFPVLFVGDARVVHLKGGTSPVQSLTAQRKRRPRYYYAARARYLAKHYGTLGLWASNVMWTAGRAVSKARELVGNKNRQACDHEWLDIWTNGVRPMKPWAADRLQW